MHRDTKSGQNEKLLFLRKFFQKGRGIASLAPSSQAIAAATCKYVTPEAPQIILELGAGTGAITEFILQKMHPQSKLISVESDPEFACFLQQRCPGANIFIGEAQNSGTYLQKIGINNVDLIISGLPVPSLPKEVNLQILQLCQQLMTTPNTTFSQITALPYVYLPFYKKLFKQVEYTMVWREFPPGGVYHCKNLRPDLANVFQKN